ncbi:MAG: phosphotransferase [Polyangiaceae bacterium]|nr:phosphotransferase [Polyangiaceae bacterium]
MLATSAPPTALATFAVDFAPLTSLVYRTFGAEPLVTPMPGGASTRRYYRLVLPDGRRAVAMYMPEGGKPEEVHNTHGAERWPFLDVRELLDTRGIHVPALFAEDTDHGWLVIEDLGDDTLANWLLKHPADKSVLYTQAVTDLARAQRALADLPKGSFVASRRFDFDMLRWEIEHFREWGLDARGQSFAASDVATWNRIADRLARRVADLPYCFVHRDYQSRNLMVARARGTACDMHLVWIDFQDALLGPRVYDLVALLSDSYQEFDRAFVEARLDEYAQAADVPWSSRAELIDEFDLVTVQRKLKDAGRFVFIDRQKNNPSFLKFVPKTIHKVRAALERLAPGDSDMRDLFAILQRTLGNEFEVATS